MAYSPPSTRTQRDDDPELPVLHEVDVRIAKQLHGMLLRVDPARRQIESLCTRRRESTRSNNQRLTKTAVKMEAMRPMVSVTANPLIGPVPNWNRKSAEIRVVTWVSMIEVNARSKPMVDRRADGSPGAHLLPDALEDEHVGVHRHADGQDDAGDAGQGQRRVEQRPCRRTGSATLSTSAMTAFMPDRW